MVQTAGPRLTTVTVPAVDVLTPAELDAIAATLFQTFQQFGAQRMFAVRCRARRANQTA